MFEDWREKHKKELIDLFKKHAVQYGDFPLSAGGRSNYFVDASKITMRAQGARLIALWMWEHEETVECTAIGGPSIGADPIVGSYLFLAGTEAYDNLKGFVVRKEEKGGRMIEGDLGPGDNVIIVDDVVTTGTQTLRAIREVEKTGAEVKLVFSVVDRLAGAGEKLQNYNYFPLLTIHDLGIK